MIHLKYIDIGSIDESTFYKLLTTIPASFHEEICRYVFFKDRVRCLLGKIMVCRRYLETGYTPDEFELNWYRDINNKPHLTGWKTFNISHSGNYVVYAETSEKVLFGVDIEWIDGNIEIEELVTFFCKEEQEFILKNQQDKRAAFFDVWTRKEALLKASGIGIIDGLNQCNCLESAFYWKENEWIIFCPDFSDPEYKLHIAYSTCNGKQLKVFTSMFQL